MLMLDRRLQVLVDDDRYGRLEAEARRRGTTVGAVVRDALDRAYPPPDRETALEWLLAAEPMDVPEDPRELRREFDAAHER